MTEASFQPEQRQPDEQLIQQRQPGRGREFAK
jgi:hypothetical protein